MEVATQKSQIISNGKAEISKPNVAFSAVKIIEQVIHRWKEHVHDGKSLLKNLPLFLSPTALRKDKSYRNKTTTLILSIHFILPGIFVRPQSYLIIWLPSVSP